MKFLHNRFTSPIQVVIFHSVLIALEGIIGISALLVEPSQSGGFLGFSVGRWAILLANLVAVGGIFFEGDNVMYDDTGANYFDPSNDEFLRKMNRSEIKERLSKEMAVPSYRLQLNFLNLDEASEIFLAPYELNIKRLSK